MCKSEPKEVARDERKWSDDDVQEICNESDTQTSHFLAVTSKK